MYQQTRPKREEEKENGQEHINTKNKINSYNFMILET